MTVSVDPSLAAHFLLAEKESRLREANARIRELEARLGQADDATGKYWLEKTALLEHVHDAALRAVRLEPALCELDDATQKVEALRAPACRSEDHQIGAQP